jgi:hypothetical protein
MATADSVKAKMQGLIDSANAKTGGNDSTLTAVVNALIAGYGSGGGSSGGTSGIYVAEITPSSAENTLNITHDLGTTDILIAAIWAEDALGGITPDNNATLASVWTKTDIPNNRNAVGNSWVSSYNATNNYTVLQSPTSAAYWNKVSDENTFTFSARAASAAKFVIGVTYTVIVIARNAFSDTGV